MLPRQKNTYPRALEALHVSCIPDSLGCRQEQYREIEAAVTGMLDDDVGGCIYISGVPGTGKTASVQILVKNLQNQHHSRKIQYLEINGLKITEPTTAYVLLWEALCTPPATTITGADLPVRVPRHPNPLEALNQLTRYFENRNRPRGPPLIVLIDELDQLMTRSQDVVYNFFDWPSLPGSRLMVFAIANTHDLPERVLSARVRSRLGMIRFNFAPYKSENLQDIVNERLHAAGITNVFADDAIRLAAMRVSNLSGDARRMLEICRRAVEVAMAAGTVRVTTAQMNKVISAMQMTPTKAYLWGCSFQERVMLASLFYCIRSSSVLAVPWAEVREQHVSSAERLAHAENPSQMLTTAQLYLVLNSLQASHAVIVEDRPCSGKMSEDRRRLMLNLEAREVQQFFEEVGNQTWRDVFAL